jgi:hypothetical protein
MSYGSENDDRVGRDEESEELRKIRDSYYPVLRRINSNADYFNEFYAKRYRARALFGEGADEPYNAIWRVIIEVRTAAMMLMRRDVDANNPGVIKHREQMENRIWEGSPDDDPLVAKVSAAILAAENVFRPFIDAVPEAQ